MIGDLQLRKNSLTVTVLKGEPDRATDIDISEVIYLFLKPIFATVDGGCGCGGGG